MRLGLERVLDLDHLLHVAILEGAACDLVVLLQNLLHTCLIQVRKAAQLVEKRVYFNELALQRQTQINRVVVLRHPHIRRHAAHRVAIVAGQVGIKARVARTAVTTRLVERALLAKGMKPARHRQGLGVRVARRSMGARAHGRTPMRIWLI